jgi:Cystathionine beta-lyases/cystathionine gamma-synthases
LIENDFVIFFFHQENPYHFSMQRSFMMDRTEKIETKIIHTGRDPQSFGGGVNPPVYHFSTVLYKSVDELVSR